VKTMLRWGWAVILIWIAAAAGLFFSAPDMEELVREKGQISVPEGYSSTIAQEMLNEMNAGEEGGAATVLVFHEDGGLDEAALEEVRLAVEKLEQQKEQLGLLSVTSHFDLPELKERLVSEDGSTVLVALEVNIGERTPAEARDALYASLEQVSVDHYLTGGWLIDEDVIVSSQEGVKRTELITVAIILIILLLVFRSPVAPLIPLVTIGISYAAAQSVVAYLVDLYDFPLSNFTQIFMVAIMFGIGTDYCILLISRYREELANGGGKAKAVSTTYRTAGKTVLFSGIAVLVGFSVIGLSEFILYRSAVAVAVGVAVLMIALYTVIPVLMYWLGAGLFWPSKKAIRHKDNKLWGGMGRFAAARPLLALAIIAAVSVPLLLTYTGRTSFNSLDEIGEKYDSVKAFNIIADRFGPGESLPGTIVVRTGEPLDNADGLAAIEKVSREVAALDSVASVRSATRPTGAPIEQFQVSHQAGLLDDGLGEGREGILQIRDGLAEARDGLASAAPELQKAADAAGQLAQGTEQLKQGVAELGAGLARVEEGLRQGSDGAKELLNGLSQAADSAAQLQEAHVSLMAGYREAGAGLELLAEKYRELEAGMANIAQGLGGIDGSLRRVAEKYPELGADADFLTAQQTVAQLAAGADEMRAGLGALNDQLAQVVGGIRQANEGYAQALEGQAQFASALVEIREGLARLAAGIDQAATGQAALAAGVPKVTEGLDGVAAGQAQLAEGMAEFHYRMAELQEGLAQSTDGLSQVADGIETAQQYLGELRQNGADAGFHAPPEALEDEQFAQALDLYLSKDRRTAKWDVTFADHPYSKQALNEVEHIRETVVRAMEDAGFQDAEIAIGGVTSAYHDLDTISGRDYDRTVALMLAGIAVILAVLLRSLVMPLYLIASLILTYFTSLAVTELIFVDGLGYSGISWAVPFFGFVMLLALGVDYSIFLMDRFNEYKSLPVREAMLLAMKKMGGVVISAAVILGGTFAAMLPSGVLSLLQIATLVLTGLLLYALVFMPLFVPVMVNLFGSANWWPFRRRREREADEGGNIPVDNSGGVVV